MIKIVKNFILFKKLFFSFPIPTPTPPPSAQKPIESPIKCPKFYLTIIKIKSKNKMARRAPKKPAPKKPTNPKAGKSRRITKKTFKSKEMERTFNQGQEYLNHRNNILEEKRREAEAEKARKSIAGRASVKRVEASKKPKKAPVAKRARSESSDSSSSSSSSDRRPPARSTKVARPTKVTKITKPPKTSARMGPPPPAPRKVATSSKASLKNDTSLAIPSFGVIDVCFCIDATGSMSSYIAQAKKTATDIINNISRKVQAEGIQLSFAIVTYRDHPPQQSTYVTKVKDFTDERQIRDYISTLDAFGGGDFPEAVHDGLLVAAKDLSWRNFPGVPSLRYIFHIADAPPHGKEFDQGSKPGCTCGITTDAVSHAINHQQIHYRLIKIGSNASLNLMEKVFKERILDFDSTEIKNAKEMNVRVSDMIIREIMPM